MTTITASTPRETYTIADKSFSIYQPFATGDTITEGEASQLNQVYAENIRNNQAKAVKAAVAANTFDQDAFQSIIDAYMASYQMGVRTATVGRTTDPVMAEAMEIAKDKVKAAIVKAGGKVKDYKAADIAARAKTAIESGKYPDIMTTATAIVAARNAVSSTDASEDATLAAPPVAKAPKAAKAAA